MVSDEQYQNKQALSSHFQLHIRSVAKIIEWFIGIYGSQGMFECL